MIKSKCNIPPTIMDDYQFDDAIINQLNYNNKLVDSFIKESYNLEAFEHKFKQLESVVINGIDLAQYITASQASKLLRLKEGSFYNKASQFRRIKLSRIMIYSFQDIKDHYYKSLEVFK